MLRTLVLLLLAARAASYSDDLARKASALEKTPEGRSYDPSFDKTLSDQVNPVMQSCAGLLVTSDLKAVDLVLLLGSSGSVVEGRVKPESAAGKCIRDGVSRINFPKPPAPPRLMHVRLKVNVSAHGD